MPDRTMPPAPAHPESSGTTKAAQAPIADRRAQFARKAPQTAADRERARAFIAGKIDMVRADRTMSEPEKTAAIADLEQKLKSA